MKNKILILLMSCSKDLYEKEELACRETFLKDAEGAGVPYYFYKGGDQQLTDNENHTITVMAPDGLGGTALKTVLAFAEALKMDDWDYVVKTNVSTWLDVKKILKAVGNWEGMGDTHIYGARYLTNKASRNVPFPRGHFTVLSRSLVKGVVQYSPALLKASGFPKTDDTLICLSLLYHIQRQLKENYISRLMETPAVISWTEDIVNAPEWTDALSIRCKDETEPENTPDNMRTVHELKSTKNPKKAYRRPMGPLETPYGMMEYAQYDKYLKVAAAKEKGEEAKKVEEMPKEPPKDDRIEAIRRKLRGELSEGDGERDAETTDGK